MHIVRPTRREIRLVGSNKKQFLNSMGAPPTFEKETKRKKNKCGLHRRIIQADYNHSEEEFEIGID